MQVVLRELFEKLGTTYIKLGQFIASSPTLFPESYVLEFQRSVRSRPLAETLPCVTQRAPTHRACGPRRRCLDRAEPVDYETIRTIIRSELGRPIEEVFEFIDPRPLASASIAQVRGVPAVCALAEQCGRRACFTLPWRAEAFRL